MSSHPPKDSKLTEFLRQHRPTVPPAAPDLEARILAQVQPIPSLSQRRQQFRQKLPFVLAVSVLVAFFTYRLVESFRTAAELSNLEAFLESDWNSAINDSSENSLFNDLATNDFITR